MTFVKGGIPGFPPLAYTQDIKNLLADIYAGKLSVSEARQALNGIHEKEPPDSPFLNWLGVVIVSIGFTVDVVGTWEGMLWAGITGMATGLRSSPRIESRASARSPNSSRRWPAASS